MEFGSSDSKNKNIDSDILNTIIQNSDIEDDHEDKIQDITNSIILRFIRHIKLVGNQKPSLFYKRINHNPRHIIYV